MKKYIGATVIAFLTFLILNMADALLFEANTNTFMIFISALWKSAVFAFLFHILHNFFARLLKWYQ